MSVVAVRTEHGHTLVGEYGELHAYLAAAVAAGRLTPDGLLAQGQLPDGRCYARVRLLPETAPAVTPVPAADFWTPRRAAIAAGVALGVFGALLTGAYLVLSWAAAHAGEIFAALVILGLVAALATPRICKTVVTVYHRH